MSITGRWGRGLKGQSQGLFPCFLGNAHTNMFQPCEYPFVAYDGLSLAKRLPRIWVKALQISSPRHLAEASSPLLNSNNTNVEDLEASTKGIAIVFPAFGSKEEEFESQPRIVFKSIYFNFSPSRPHIKFLFKDFPSWTFYNFPLPSNFVLSHFSPNNQSHFGQNVFCVFEQLTILFQLIIIWRGCFGFYWSIM